MTRERALQVVLLAMGLYYLAWAFITFDILWHSSWLEGHQDALPMFTSVNGVLGICLLLSVRHPARHRSLIAYAAWASLAHACTMTIQTAAARAHGMQRADSPQDIVINGVVGVLLLGVFIFGAHPDAQAARGAG